MAGEPKKENGKRCLRRWIFLLNPLRMSRIMPLAGVKLISQMSIIEAMVSRFSGWDIIDIIRLNLIELMFDPEELSKNVNLQLAVSALSDLLEENFENLVRKADRELETLREGIAWILTL